MKKILLLIISFFFISLSSYGQNEYAIDITVSFSDGGSDCGNINGLTKIALLDKNDNELQEVHRQNVYRQANQTFSRRFSLSNPVKKVKFYYVRRIGGLSCDRRNSSKTIEINLPCQDRRYSKREIFDGAISRGSARIVVYPYKPKIKFSDGSPVDEEKIVCETARVDVSALNSSYPSSVYKWEFLDPVNTVRVQTTAFKEINDRLERTLKNFTDCIGGPGGGGPGGGGPPGGGFICQYLFGLYQDALVDFANFTGDRFQDDPVWRSIITQNGKPANGESEISLFLKDLYPNRADQLKALNNEKISIRLNPLCDTRNIDKGDVADALTIQFLPELPEIADRKPEFNPPSCSYDEIEGFTLFFKRQVLPGETINISLKRQADHAPSTFIAKSQNTGIRTFEKVTDDLYKYVWKKDDPIIDGKYRIFVSGNRDGIEPKDLVESCKERIFGDYDIRTPKPIVFENPVVQQDEQCFGAKDGIIKIKASGGTETYKVFLNGRVTTPISTTKTRGVTELTFNNLAPRSYQITVRDTNDCQARDTSNKEIIKRVTIQAKTDINHVVNATHVVDPSAPGAKDATIDIQRVTGGTPFTSNRYTYVILLNGSTSNLTVSKNISNSGGFITGLPAGRHKIRYTDANGCTKTLPLPTVTDPLPIKFTLTKEDPKCFKGIGKIIVSGISGGYSDVPYEIIVYKGGKKEKEVIATTPITRIDVLDGDYTVEVKDHRKGSLKKDIKIIQPNEIKITKVTPSPILCYGKNSRITVTATGGQRGVTYQYAISKRGTLIWQNSNVFSLKASTIGYRFIVRDKNLVSCQSKPSDPTPIRQPEELYINPNPKLTHNTIFNAAKGSIELAILGGEPARTGYEVTWEKDGKNIPNEGAKITGLKAGTYKATIKDSLGCTLDSEKIEIRQPDKLKVTISIDTPINCHGETGILKANAIGGLGDYKYQWFKDGSEISKATAVTHKNTSANYTVLVKDNYTSVTSTIKKLPEVPKITLSLTKTDATCNNLDNGTIKLNIGGGTPPYEFSIDNKTSYEKASDLTNNTIEGLTNGTYQVWIKDRKGCIIKTPESIEVKKPSKIEIIEKDRKHNDIIGESKGEIIIEVKGGSGSYNYTWTSDKEPSFNKTTLNLTALPAAIYTVVVKDRSRLTCLVQKSFEIKEPLPLAVKVKQTEFILCNGQNTGALLAEVSGGFPLDSKPSDFDYKWYKIEAGVATLLNSSNLKLTLKDKLIAGTYRVDVNDAKGIKTSSAIITIKQPDPVKISLQNKVDVSCFNGDDGSITIEVEGGNKAYSYVWKKQGDATFSEDKKDITSLKKGKYYVEVTDGTCPVVVSEIFEVTEPASLPKVTTFNITHLTGFETGNGSIIIDVAGGASTTYNYLWKLQGDPTFSRNTKDLEKIEAGTYQLTLTNDKCTILSDLYTVKQPKKLVIDELKQIGEIKCFGDETITLTTTASGGVGDYTYSWKLKGSDTELGDNKNSLVNIGAGIYIVKITDENLNVIEDDIEVKQPPVLQLLDKDIITTDVSCFDGNNGTIKVAASGGVGGYSYTWDHGVGITGNELTGLKAREYTVTIRDKNLDCVLIKTIKITQPKAKLIIENKLVENAKGHNLSNGSISITVTGGTKPYKYEWKDAFNVIKDSKTNIQTGLKAGEYTVKVTDAKGCIINPIPKYVVGEPDPLNIKFKEEKISCHGEKGSVIAKVTGGVAPYKYSWNLKGETSVLSTTDELKGISGGTYVVSIFDDNLNFITKEVFVFEPPLLQLLKTDIDKTDVSCHKGSDGYIKVKASGGVGDYSYTWDHGVLGNELINLKAGMYQVTIRDKNLTCVVTQKITIKEPEHELIVQDYRIVDATRNGLPNGSISLTVFGGTSPYTYQWKDALGKIKSSTTATQTDLAAGIYTVKIVDSKGCTIAPEPKYEVEQPDPLKITFDKKEINCHGEKITIKANVIGGVPPYRYSWNLKGEAKELSTTDELKEVGGGTYVVKVLDKNDNPIENEIFVFEPTLLEFENIETHDITCYNGTDGFINVTVKGGTLPYIYQWNHTSLDVNKLEKLKSDTYTLKVIDAKGCEIQTAPIILTQPVLYDVTKVKLVRPSSDITTDGNIEIFITGGEAPYQYVWKNQVGSLISNTRKDALNDKIDNLSEGKYSLTITDAKNCTIIKNYNLANPGELLVEVTQTQEITCYGASNAILDVITVGGVGGNNYQWFNASDNTPLSNTKELRNVPIGFYYIIVSNAEGIEEQSANFEVTQPQELTLDIMATDLSCHDTIDGIFKLDIKGGLSGYEFRYKGGAQTNFSDWNQIIGNTTEIQNLLNGNYTIQVRDQKKCFAKNKDGGINFEIEILKPSMLAIQTEVIENATGFDVPNGSVSINIIGGSSIYTYVWTDKADNEISNTNSINGVKAGDYKVSIQDNKGCSLIKMYTITEPLPLKVTTEVVSVISCKGEKDGVLEAIVEGGIPPYKYTWHKEGSTVVLGTASTLPRIGDGSYYVKIEDAKTNKKTSAIQVFSEPVILEGTISAAYILCGIGNDWTIDTNIKGGTPPYRYLWNTGDSSASLQNVVAGNYEVLILDANGCSISKNITLTPPPRLEIDSETTNHVTGFGLSNGSISITVVGGTPPYNYNWLNSENTSISTIPSINNIVSGDYTVTIEDSKGCSLTKEYNITQPLALEATIAVNSIISCKAEEDGQLEAQVKGGVTPYSYTWYKEGTTTILGNNVQFSNIGEGRYYVKVIDANLNEITSPIKVFSEPDVLEVALNSEYTLCGTANDWTISTEVKGGTPPYRYLWNTGTSNAFLNNVIAGDYNVLIVDANGCRITENITVTPPPTLKVLDQKITHPTCFKGNDGKIDIELTGGTPPYMYQWDNDKTTQNINELSSGSYQVTITDSKGCQIIETYTVIDPEEIALDLGKDVTLCQDQNYILDGTIEDGTRYSWTATNGFLSNEAIIEVAQEGVYTIIATNIDGCVVEDQIEIKRSKDKVSSDFIMSSIAFVDEPFVAVNVSDPAPENLEWMLPTQAIVTEKTAEFVELYFEQEGEYEVTFFTKRGNCESFTTKKVIVTKKTIEDTDEQANNGASPVIKDFVIYPNPSSGVFSLELKLKEISDVNVKIYSLLSNNLIDYKEVKEQEEYKIDYNLNLVPGMYFVLIETQNEKLVKKIIIK